VAEGLGPSGIEVTEGTGSSRLKSFVKLGVGERVLSAVTPEVTAIRSASSVTGRLLSPGDMIVCEVKFDSELGSIQMYERARSKQPIIGPITPSLPFHPKTTFNCPFSVRRVYETGFEP
jgi:hypothetical protein